MYLENIVMNRLFKFTLLLLLSIIVFQSCENYDEYKIPNDLKVQDFVWKGLNLYYLWQADVPNLADNRFTGQNDLNTFLYGYSNPNDLFQHLLNKPVSLYPTPGEAIDRFSVIFQITHN